MTRLKAPGGRSSWRLMISARDLPGGGRHGEVPGRDDGHHPDGLAPHVDLDARADRIGGIADLPQGLGRVVGEELARAVDLSRPLGPRLAFLARQQLAQLRRAGHELVADGHQYFVTGLQSGSGPLGRRGPGGGDGGLRLRPVGLGVEAHDIGQVRRTHVLDAGGAGDPLAADQVRVFLARHASYPCPLSDPPPFGVF
jgi:hypothetical protein